jgi:hypothetical protein
MPATLEDRLVVAISSRALFDFEEENRIFEAHDDRAYMQLQLQRLEQPARPGVAFSLVNKLLAFNPSAAGLLPGAPGASPAAAEAARQRVEVVILSRNDPVSGMRVFRSAQHYGRVHPRSEPLALLEAAGGAPVSVGQRGRRALGARRRRPGRAGGSAQRARLRRAPERGPHRVRR